MNIVSSCVPTHGNQTNVALGNICNMQHAVINGRSSLVKVVCINQLEGVGGECVSVTHYRRSQPLCFSQKGIKKQSSD